MLRVVQASGVTELGLTCVHNEYMTHTPPESWQHHCDLEGCLESSTAWTNGCLGKVGRVEPLPCQFGLTTATTYFCSLLGDTHKYHHIKSFAKDLHIGVSSPVL